MAKKKVSPGGQKARILSLGLACAFGAILLIGLLRTITSAPPFAGALAQDVTLRYVDSGGNDSSNDCLNSATPCATIQHAVDVAGAATKSAWLKGPTTTSTAARAPT